MRLKEIPHGLALATPADGYVRTAGRHASDLYNSYYKGKDPKRYDKRDKDGNPTPMDMAKLELGLCFEQDLEVMLASMARRMAKRLLGDRPGEFESPHEDGCSRHREPVVAGVPCPECGAGTIYSPDYLFDDGNELILGEFKCSWYSAFGAPTDPKFAKWWTQIKLYSHWLGVRRARLYVFFVNGDYKPPSPQLRCWEVVFTARELQDEFNEIARDARKKGLFTA